MQLNRELILDTAFDILAAYGLGDLSMRRLAKGLEVAPGALYWHFPSKQVLLGAVADRILGFAATGEEPDAKEGTDRAAGSAAPGPDGWRDRAATVSALLLDRLLSTRDGAEIVSAALATDTLGQNPVDPVSAALDGAPGTDPRLAAWVLVRYLLGAATELQTAHATDTDPCAPDPEGTGRILAGVDLILDGVGRTATASAVHDEPGVTQP